ncbi:MAG TPA: hypothetical protein VK644_07555 [Chitinophagaceae bacterium]|nr:hypothetical protein [Chitinophagaceae bacterium]
MGKIKNFGELCRGEDPNEIFFVNSGNVTRAGSFDEAVGMLLEGKRGS